MLLVALTACTDDMLISEAAKEDILRHDEKGMDGYRLVPDAPMSVLSTMKKMKPKNFSTWMAKIMVSV